MDKPICWCIGWDANIELGFENGTYLPRKAAIILYPEYFDEHGEPRLYMLPIDGDKNNKENQND